MEPENLDNDVVFEESTEEGIELGGAAKVKKLQDKIKLLEKEKAEYLDGWQRARADYANLQKTSDEDKKRVRALVEESFIEDLLPTLDSFAMAFSNVQAWEKVEPTWRTGVEYIYQQFLKALNDKNVSIIPAKIGDSFDAYMHESIESVETEDVTKDHTIAAVVQQGYLLGEKVLRPARVKVYAIK
ncbi:MAG: nucleotide exchange factor GrpE [bacterium]